jgi:hypothetical protein
MSSISATTITISEDSFPPSIQLPYGSSKLMLDVDYEERIDRYEYPLCSDPIEHELVLSEIRQRRKARTARRILQVYQMSPESRSLYLSNLHFDTIADMFAQTRFWFRVFCLDSMNDDLREDFLPYWEEYLLAHPDISK